MFKYVTAETVSPGHPDKIADLISDYVLTKALENNPSSRVAVETVFNWNQRRWSSNGWWRNKRNCKYFYRRH